MPINPKAIFKAIKARLFPALLICTLAILVLYYPFQYARMKIYFLQDFQSMTPIERVERFSWSMHTWRYRFSSRQNFFHGSWGRERDYIRDTFQNLYPPGNPVGPLFESLKRKSATCWKSTSTPNKFSCRYGFLRPLFSINHWGIDVRYDEATKAVTAYSPFKGGI